VKIFVKVKPNAKKESLKKTDPSARGARTGDMHFAISVKAPPKNGKANRAVLRALRAYLRIPPSRLEILTGHTSKLKVIRVYTKPQGAAKIFDTKETVR
jgi:uncharacterized protein